MEVIQYAIEGGADNLQCGLRGALKSGNLETVKLMTYMGARIKYSIHYKIPITEEIFDFLTDNKTPVEMLFSNICYRGNIKLAEKALAKNPQIKLDYGKNAACCGGQYEMLMFLLKINPNIEYLAAPAIRGRSMKIIEYLLDAGEEPRDFIGWACNYREYHISEYFLRKNFRDCSCSGEKSILAKCPIGRLYCPTEL